MVSHETQEHGIVEIGMEIWSLRDHLKSLGLLELLCLVKVTQTHTQSGLQSSSQGFLSHGLHFPLQARIFYLQSLILYLYFLPPFLLPLVLFQHSFKFWSLSCTLPSADSPDFPILSLPRCLSTRTPLRGLLLPSTALSAPPPGCLPCFLCRYPFITPSGKPGSLCLSPQTIFFLILIFGSS